MGLLATILKATPRTAPSVPPHVETQIERDEAIRAAEDAARTHHAAILPFLLGHVPGTTIDPFLFAVLVGAMLSEADAEDVPKMRRWPLPTWTKAINRQLAAYAETAPAAPAVETEPGPLAEVIPIRAAAPEPAPAPEPFPTGPEQLRRQLRIVLPPPPEPPEPPPPGGAAPDGTPSTDIIPAPPQGLPTELREAWIQARTRAGEYCRGLGNYVAEDTGQIVREAWDRENITEDVDPEHRLRTIAIIREKVAIAVESGQTAQKLASELGDAAQDWSRNWLRIAETELQGALNDGVVTQAIRAFGDAATVAGVPNANACVDCRRLLLDEDGHPRVFRVADLLANGTNVGRPRREWKASVWPQHPRCRCHWQVIPPGTRLTADGRLERTPNEDE